MNSKKLKAPFPYFGGKSRCSDLVWSRLGRVNTYIEPFFGSGAVLLGSPYIPAHEIVNDIDGFVCNFWRAIKQDPDAVVSHCDMPQNANDYNARKAWLASHREELVQRLEGDPDFFDVKLAGWWVWGVCMSISLMFPGLPGPWHAIDGKLVKTTNRTKDGIRRERPSASQMGVHRLNLRQACTENLLEWFGALAQRLKFVKVCCGDWHGICGYTYWRKGIIGVFFDPPYQTSCDKSIYSTYSPTVAGEVRDWCVEHEDNPRLRIALCGYDGDYDMPDGWSCVAWKSVGYTITNNARKNKGRERIWFSPHCVTDSLFELT